MWSPLNMVHMSLLPLLIVAFVGLARALDNGLARTPPMGWLSWERFTCTTDCEEFPNDCINNQLYQAMAQRLIHDGYASKGYEYVNIDDCWSEKERDAVSGKLVAAKTRFPGGISRLADYVHSLSLKLGIYGDCGTKTCAGYPAQLKDESNLEDNYFERDSNQLAEWNVDSFKFDGCFLDPYKSETICPKMSQAIKATGRPILLICEWPFYMLRQWYNFNKTDIQPNFALAQQSCNVWRYYEDVEDSWLSVLSIIDFTIRMQSTIVKYHGPGSWFDPDQLVIGNFALSLDQARAQMAIWSIWSAPLYMSNDLRHIDVDMANVLKNDKLIAVDQDQLGVFGLMAAETNNGLYQAFVKPVEPIKKGCPSFVIVYFNRNTLGNRILLEWNIRELLSKVPIALAAQRYSELYTGTRPGGEFSSDYCKRFIKLAMTSDQNTKDLLNKPINSVPSERMEEKQVKFNVVDLFDDEPSKILPLTAKLTLKVNPSGVRVVKLIQI